MPTIAKISLINLLATAVVTASTEDVTFTASPNGREPQKPFKPWRSTVTTASWLKFNMGSAKVLDVIAPIADNFASVTIEGNATDSFVAPTYSQAITIARNPWNWRYQNCHTPGDGFPSFNLQWLRLNIGAQTPVDAAAFFRVGGVWAGAFVAMPAQIEWGLHIQTIQPERLIRPSHNAWTQRQLAGEPRTIIKTTLRMSVAPSSLALGDQLQTMQDQLRQIRDADYFLFWTNTGDRSQVWVMRVTSEIEWTVNRGRAETQFVLEEVTGP